MNNIVTVTYISIESFVKKEINFYFDDQLKMVRFKNSLNSYIDWILEKMNIL